MNIPERSTAAIDLTFKDENGDLIAVASVTALVLEVFGRSSSPLFQITSLPVTNPQRYVLDLTTYDLDSVGSRISVEFKMTYNSTTLGIGAVLRGGPFRAIFTNSRVGS